MSYKDLDPFNYIDIKPQNYKSKQQLIIDLEDISKTLENITNDWKEREFSLQKLGTIAKGNLNKSDIFTKYFNTKLCNFLEIQLSDLRSSVMKEACRITSLCSRELELLIEPGITQLLSQNCLFKIAGSANKVISDSSSKCILNIVRYIHSSKVISNICEIKAMKANNVRILCAQCLVNIISYYDNNFIIKSKDIIEETIKCLLVDPNAEVRSTTRKAFILYKSIFEEEAEILFNELGKNVQKQINEDEKNFDTNFKIKMKHEKDEKYLKSISKEIENNLNKINYKENVQNKPKSPEFNLLKKNISNDLNKRDNVNANNKNKYFKKTKSNKKSVAKNDKKRRAEEKEETVKYINVDDDDVADNETSYLDLNDNEEEKTTNNEFLDNSGNGNDANKHNSMEDSKEINAVFNYSNKPVRKLDNKNNAKIAFNKKDQNQNKKYETTINKLNNLTDNNPIKLQKENKYENKLFQSQNLNNYFDINNKNNNLINNENITSNKNDINDFNIDDLLSNKEYNNSNNNKKHKKIIANNSSKISKTKSSVNTERTNNIDTSQKNANNINKIKSKNKQKNDNIDSTNKNQQILKKLNAKFEQLESGVVVSAMGRTMKKNNFINDKKRGKSGEKMKIHYEFNKIKNPKNSKTKKNSNNNFNLNTNIIKSNKTIDSTLYKSTNINLNTNNIIEDEDEGNNSHKEKKILSNKEIKIKEEINIDADNEDNELEEELDTVIDIDLDKNRERTKTYNKKKVQSKNKMTHKEKINPKANTYHFSKSNNKNNKTIINSISYENYINIALNNNVNNNSLVDKNYKKEENLLSNESIEDKINAIIDKLDNLMNQNEKLILFQYLFNYFNSTLQEIKTFSPNTIKRYINIHIENLKENDKNLVEQIIKNLMRMIFYMNYIFNTYEIESILKLLLFSINDINDKTLIKLSNQLLEIIKKKCDNEELFKSVYSLLGEYNTNYDNCYEFMYLLIPECGNILNNNNYFKQVFRLICLTDINSKKVGKIIDILYRKYSNNFSQAYEEEISENKNKILMLMEKTNSLYYREFKSSHENISNINTTLNNKINDKNNIINNNIKSNVIQIKKDNEANDNEIDNISKENLNNNFNNINNKNSNLSNNVSYKNNIIYNQSSKNSNNISTINTNLSGNNIISINNSNNNNIIITNKLPDDSLPNDIKQSIQNNNLEQYILYMEEHKSYIPEFILLLSNKKYNDEKSAITLLNFTKSLLNSSHFLIDLNACINLMVKQLIYILTSHKNNEKIIELIKNILSNMPINLNADKTLSSMAKFLNIDNDSIILETLLVSIQNYIINSKNRKKDKMENSEGTNLENLLKCFINEVFNLLKHQNSEIRKRAVYCCVEINLVIGKEFENYLGKIPKNQQNLIKLYLKKRMS